jgi:hypothetical protein
MSVVVIEGGGDGGDGGEFECPSSPGVPPPYAGRLVSSLALPDACAPLPADEAVHLSKRSAQWPSASWRSPHTWRDDPHHQERLRRIPTSDSGQKLANDADLASSSSTRPSTVGSVGPSSYRGRCQLSARTRASLDEMLDSSAAWYLGYLSKP